MSEPERSEPTSTLEKTYRPGEVETRLYAAWESSGAFRCDPSSKAKPYCIVIPPPNVTGSLHMGHALNNTLQDILIRRERMRGRDVLWQPGTDHAGIATQMVVERQLAAEGVALARGKTVASPNQKLLGREAFVERVWRWKEESGGTITRQLKRLGASADWSREAFTMDETLSRAVRKVFVELHKAGLIYRDKRLVNWDPRFHTAISDLEVEQREVKGHLWHLKYPIEGTENTYICVATTRPETMLGDTAIAVHPDDERYRALVGRHAVLPLVGRRIPIVADDYADPEHGSGAVKITPAHDFNDFEVARRHGLAMVNIFDADAHLIDTVPEAYRGLERMEARKRVLADLEALGLVEKAEEITHTVPYGDRSGVPIEPWLTDQWFCDAATLAKPAIAAVEEGRTRFVPAQWAHTYFEWMRNIQPWCVSRQLWWGHQIPAWYGPDGTAFVELTEDEAQAAAAKHYGKPAELRRDPDVLDTWFSSALWPFSTLGWPDETAALKRYYPTDVLVTGFDIIFFWVARMMMTGLHFMKKEPFHTVYIHALVRDEKGQKMSKSKGNVIDPLDLIDKYGADAMRFTLAALAAQGRDIKLSEKRVEGYRNFATKLWNAARYCEMNDAIAVRRFEPGQARLTVNRWILGELARTAGAVDEALDAYRFNDAASALYQFTWGTFCDWYVEFTKPILLGADAAAKEETRAATAYVLRTLLALLHPFMPFITEELWEKLGFKTGPMLIRESWPDLSPVAGDATADAEMGWVVSLISSIRAVRAEMNVSPAAQIDMVLNGASTETLARFDRHRDLIVRLARLKAIERDAAVPKGSAQLLVGEATVALPLAGVIDLEKERTRLDREVARLEGEIGKIDKKLGDAAFVAKAPPEVVELQRERRAEAEEARDRLRQALSRLG
ncbi:MAG: valine--tRNA ligase [Alphaproteobacteria bacterium]